MWPIDSVNRAVGDPGQNLIQRVVTSVLGIPVVLAVVLSGEPRIVAVIFTLLLGRTTLELGRLTLNKELRAFYLLAAVAITVLAFLFISGTESVDRFRVIIAAIILAMLIGAFGAGTISQRAARCEGMLVAVIYPLATWAPIWELWLHSHWFPLYVLGIAWGSDTAAFMGGQWCGRHKLMPVISPKKTWEGAIFGFIGGVGVALIIRWLAGSALMTWNHLLLVSPLTAICAQAGDALKSVFKRVAGVKDTGSCLPGHGGLLDRIDSVLLAGAFVWMILPLLD